MNALLVSHYPLPSTITLASPRKRGGGTANATLVFINTKFRKSALNISQTNPSRDGGDCFPLALSLRCYPLTFKRVRFCCSVKPSQLWWGLWLLSSLKDSASINFNPHRLADKNVIDISTLTILHNKAEF